MELLNKLMAGSETDGGNARLEVSGAGKTEDGLVRYNEEVNKLGDDLRELYGNMGEILGRIRDGTLFKNADKVSVVARSTDGAGVLAKHADEAAAWLHGVKVFRYSDETAEAVASGEKLLKESGTIYESFADMMSPEEAKRYLDFLENGKTTIRWYDSEGKAYRDVDMSDHGNSKEHPEVPHEHTWEYNNGKPKRN